MRRARRRDTAPGGAVRELVQALKDFATGELATLLLAVGILIAGWIVGDILARAVRAILARTLFSGSSADADDAVGDGRSGAGDAVGDERSRSSDRIDEPGLLRKLTGRLPLASVAAEVVRWTVVVYAALLFADTLGLENAAGPVSALMTGALESLPRIASGLFVLALGFGIATIVGRYVPKFINASKLAKRLDQAGEEGDGDTFGESLGTTLHALIVLFALLIALDLMRLEGVVEPLTGPATAFLAFLPRLVVVAAILGGGYVLARVVRAAVTAVLASLGIDEIGRKAGLERAGISRISGLCGAIAFVFVLLPVVAAALDAIGIEGVAGTTGSLIGTFLGGLPTLLYAALVVFVGVVFGRLLGGFAVDLLARIGFDGILAKLGMDEADHELPEARRPSRVAGTLVRIAVIVFAAAEACDLLGFGQVGDALLGTCALAGDWILGIVIFGFGLWLAGLLADLVRRQGTPSSGVLAAATRVSIGLLAAIVALEEMGLARWTVANGFLSALAGIALGVGLAFGLGGGRHARDLVNSWRREIDSGH